MARENYKRQVQLLVRTLPYVARQEVFALKGGTAINLFYRDMPRLSVDIDLVYLPVEDRPTSLAGIDKALDAMQIDLLRNLPSLNGQRIAGGSNSDTRIKIRQGSVEIKIETSPVSRGTVHPPQLRTVSESVTEKFGFAEMQVVAFEDLFGGKLHAALDRQHPRDLYDVKLLYENEGITEALFSTFLVYVASSNRPPHELLRPSLKALDHDFVAEFDGMTTYEVSLAELLDVRERLTEDIAARIDEPVRNFLLTLHEGEPDFNAVGLPKAVDLPAVQWKLLNLRKLKEQNPEKHSELLRAIEEL